MRFPHVALWLAGFLVAGCGFRPVPPAAAVADLAADVDLGGNTPDALAEAGDLTVMTGPGPLGALPAGFCCGSGAECRSRQCDVDGAGHKICIESCISSATCTEFSMGYFCDATVQRCRPKTYAYICTPTTQFVLGHKPTGACCDAGAAHPGEECLGGWCVPATPGGNPAYCTQGCRADVDCPADYACDQPSAQCHHVSTVYSCQ
jgi:hypothetical protein